MPFFDPRRQEWNDHFVWDGARRPADLRLPATEIRGLLHERFGIDHVTVQLEPEDFVDSERRVCDDEAASRTRQRSP